MQRFFGLAPVDLASRMPPDNTSFPAGPRPELRGDDVFWMNFFCKRLLREVNFEVKRTPLAPHWVLYSILRLPVWAFQNLVPLHRTVKMPFWRYLWRWVRPRTR